MQVSQGQCDIQIPEKCLTWIGPDQITDYRRDQITAWIMVACVASIQREGRGEVKFEHEVRGECEARSLGSSLPDPNNSTSLSPHTSHSNLTSSPSLPFVCRPSRLGSWIRSQSNHRHINKMDGIKMFIAIIF